MPTLRDENLHLRPGLAWIESDRPWGASWPGCCARFIAAVGGKQFFVSQAPGIGNPRFDNEPLCGAEVARRRLPAAGALPVLEHHRVLVSLSQSSGRDWDRVLAEFVPRVALAPDKDAYQLEMIQLIARVTDTHANLWSAPPQLRPPAGDCQLPVTIRFVENQAVVTGYSDAAAGPATGLRIGDVIERLDGVPVEELVGRWEPYYPASNRPTRLRDIARAMTRGACAAAGVGVRRAGGSVRLTAQRQPLADAWTRAPDDARSSGRGVPAALRARSRI